MADPGREEEPGPHQPQPARVEQTCDVLGAHGFDEDSFVEHGGVCGVVQVVVGASGRAELCGQDDVPAGQTGEVGQEVRDAVGPPVAVKTAPSGTAPV